MQELWLARHGETEWSRERRHTGRTDVPLTATGLQQAAALGRRLQEVRFALVLTSPSTRARATTEAAGLYDYETTVDLAEFDYGAYEGRTSADIKSERPEWNLWRDGCPDGETPAEVGRRVDRVLERVLGVEGCVLVVGHGHTGRILTARYLGLSPGDGGLFAFDVASLSVLGYEHARPVMLHWNEGAGGAS